MGYQLELPPWVPTGYGCGLAPWLSTTYLYPVCKFLMCYPYLHRLPTGTQMYLDLLCTQYYTTDTPIKKCLLVLARWHQVDGCHGHRLRMAVIIVDGHEWLRMTGWLWMIANDVNGHGWLQMTQMVADMVVDGAAGDYCVECKEKQKECSLDGWGETIAYDVVVY